MSYLDEIKAKYDIKDHVEPKVVVPKLPTEGIVLIVGTSGSGKTTILKTVDDPKPLVIDYTKNVIENFSIAERGEELLLACGLRTIPAWFRAPNTLSNGEFHRFEIAIGLDQGHNIIDEFT
jgi:ABC-type proline/glycine betaine transport system ATPase subunit